MPSDRVTERRETDRRHPDDREGGLDIGQPPGRPGRDHERLVTTGRQVLGDPHGRARDAVDIGWEGLCDVGDPHVLNVADAGACPGCDDMTTRRISGDK
ncbi:MAG TPA: hypothetical protein VFW16_00300 [Streptosporangiaceae bacterium]|nr:hypothetical protein [Streptosporangiaceae bacterium]